jgi:excisionase family DNA binding protein
MDDFLTTHEVLDILKVDRITVYRMLQDGRIKGQKIGQQWRFPRKEIERLTGGALPAPEPGQPATDPNGFPTHCVQTIQELFSEVGQVSALVIDTEGTPLTEISHPCRFCQVMLQSLSGQAACRASWQEFARASNTGSRYFSCHAGIQYVSAPIADHEKTFGYFLAGEFYWQAPNLHEQTERSHRLAATLDLAGETLAQASNTIPVIGTDQHAQVESWPAAAARAVQTILQERLGFLERFQQIANLIKI